MAEDEGFEPPRGFHRLSVFKTDPFNQAWVIFHDALKAIKYNNGGPYWTWTSDHPVMSRML